MTPSVAQGRATDPDLADRLERQRAREEKDWAKSDELREALLTDGITVRDTIGGPVWEYVA